MTAPTASEIGLAAGGPGPVLARDRALAALCLLALPGAVCRDCSTVGRCDCPADGWYCK